MKRFLLIFNVVLLAVAIGVTARLLRPESSNALAGMDVPEVDLVNNPIERSDVRLPWSPIREETVLMIANENLFSEGRAYIEPVSDTEPADATEAAEEPPKPTEEYELVGVVRVGGRAVASMIVRSSTVAEQQPAPAMRRRGGPGGLLRQQEQPLPAAGADGASKKDIYAVGDAVGALGYTLREIGSDHVILVKTRDDGSEEEEELRVDMDLDDDSSKERQQAALADEEKRLEDSRRAVMIRPLDENLQRGADGELTDIVPAQPPSGRLEDFVDGALETEVENAARRPFRGGRRGSADAGGRPGVGEAPAAPEPTREGDAPGIPPPIPTPPGLPQ